VKLVDAEYENGVLRPCEALPLRPGEHVSLIVLRRSSPCRWDLAKIAQSGLDGTVLSEQGLGQWITDLDAEDRSRNEARSGGQTSVSIGRVGDGDGRGVRAQRTHVSGSPH
jgi:predicted DNA-binding antitoxin AbrB/MazE fold protein